MNQRFFNSTTRLLSVLVLLIIFIASCKKKKDEVASSGVPVIEEVRNASGPITISQKAVGIEIAGKNLGDATSVTFNGYAANMNTALVTENSILVKIPI